MAGGGYPAIAARARREGAVILWLDQTGIRSDAAVGRTWAPAARTPVVGKTGETVQRDHLDRQVQVIVDGHPVHRRKTVRKWVDDHAAAIEMHFLPGYNPELNPDEIRGADLKRTMSTGTAQKIRDESKQAVRSFLHRLHKSPDQVRSYLGKPDVRYARLTSHNCPTNQ
ncbi:transposase [Saccharopolyspora sp. ASAGF58]|uniref:transposase n=2 Tax=Saccharopolyspora sp. ASAGF58 TaxID=2719023 RepID=UPI00144558FA|nr:transposase [Saccharopolyspora sp. ASAGF58]